MNRIVHPEHAVSDWPFPVPPGTGCVTTREVMEEGEPISSICHFDGGDWLFSSESYGNEEDGVIVCFACLYDKFPAIADHAALRSGFEAWLDEDTGQWVITQMYEDE